MQSVLTSLGAVVAFLALGGCDSRGALDGSLDAGDAAQADAAVSISDSEWAALRALSPAVLPAPPHDPTNRWADDPAAAHFGQQMFFEPGFSGRLLDTDNDGTPGALGVAGQTGRVACAGCHLPSGGFSDTRSFQLQISLGAGWGRRRAPSLLDVGQARLLMWDGKRDSLFSQVFGPLETVVEMNSSRLYMAEQVFLRFRTAYEAVFGPMPPLDDATRFPPLDATVTGCSPAIPSSPAPLCDGPTHGMPGDQGEFDGMTALDQDAVTTVVVNVGKAIGAYERLLSCGPGPFDAWVHGDAHAVSASAQRGAALFVGRAGCVTCHSGPYMSDQQFHNVGVVPAIVQQNFVDSGDHGALAGIAALLASPLNSAGRFSDGTDGRLTGLTGALDGAFRTPTLRCVGLRPSFLHTGQLGTLEDVVAFFAAGGDPPRGYPGVSELHALDLSPSDQSDLVAFLRGLTGAGPADALRVAPSM